MDEIKNHPSTVEFGEKECCALKIAVENATHREFIREFIKKAGEKEPKHSWAILAEIFTNTINLIFIPRGIHREFYATLAILERGQLTEGNKELACGHTVIEHIQALDNIYFLMAYPAGNN
ncbi:MAG: hypothetical protein HYW79_00220 [Parcubacteria group bacterium]|nr:hypothetical protein [Parcubacteria group bacterium]